MVAIHTLRLPSTCRTPLTDFSPYSCSDLYSDGIAAGRVLANNQQLYHPAVVSQVPTIITPAVNLGQPLQSLQAYQTYQAYHPYPAYQQFVQAIPPSNAQWVAQPFRNSSDMHFFK